MLIAVKAKKGVEKKTYVYDIHVCQGEVEDCSPFMVDANVRYGQTQQFYVKIK